jgi:hypothetical protein
MTDRNDSALPMDAFRRLLRPDFVRTFVERDLRRVVSGEAPATKDAARGQLRLIATDGLDLRARIVRPGEQLARSVVTLTRNTLVGNAGREAFALRCWSVPPGVANDVFDPAVRIAADGDVPLAPGEARAFHAGTQAYDIVPQAGAAVALTAAGSRSAALAWHYDRATRRPVRAEPAHKEWLLLRELLAFAEMLGDAALLPAIAEVADHPSHFVRWAAAKAAYRIEPDASLAALRALADDPHPQLRGAALRLLARSAAS